ncbi:MAG: hypothetical protein ACOC6C_01035 [Verrucomicrobiota bacterium]
MKQFVITPASGKRLIGMAAAGLPDVRQALESGTVVVVAGTTNACVAQEILKITGQDADFSPGSFFRGITLPASSEAAGSGRLSGTAFPGDVVIKKGKWNKGKTIFDVIDEMGEHDVIFKGANALDAAKGKAGVLIGHPKGGTILSAMQAVVGRRTRLYVPVGLEKRITDDIDSLAARLNEPGASGPRLFPVPGRVITEIEALNLLAGVQATLCSAGGVCGAEGCLWISLTGSKEQEQAAAEIVENVSNEPAFRLA